jgi:hypothetical protein
MCSRINIYIAFSLTFSRALCNLSIMTAYYDAREDIVRIQNRVLQALNEKIYFNYVDQELNLHQHFIYHINLRK